MNGTVLIVALTLVILSLDAVQAQVIGHDQVEPFRQPVPKTAAEKAAVKFKPHLKVDGVCHPYPAVQKDGSISGGLRGIGPLDGECTGSPLGSQIYGRTAWYNNMFAIVFAWYFPKGQDLLRLPYLFGHRHNWEYLVVWIDDPEDKNATVQGVSMPAAIGYTKESPVDDSHLYGNSVKVVYRYEPAMGITLLDLSEETGNSQDLIMWNQLSKLARESLANKHSFDARMPLKDDEFEALLEKNWPF